MKEQFLEAMSRAANSVNVVTTDGVAGKVGVTVSAMCSVSVEDPSPTILVCVHNLSPACDAIRTNGAFCANLLSDDQSNISDSFAGRAGVSGENKFDCANWQARATGAPVLEGSLASFDCKLLHDVLVGTHRIFIGQVEHVTCGGTGNPLLYHGRQYAAPMALIA